MVSWKSTLKPSEIAQVASFVISLRGTNPADAKAPEGDLFVNPDESHEASATDSETQEASTLETTEIPAE
jgi:cytochrome c oxidase cbb3-type subunit 3